MKRKFQIAVIAVLLSIAFVSIIPIHAQVKRNAVILSSLENLAPMGIYRTYITSSLQHDGYSVTFLHDRQITLDFLVGQLNNFTVILWRTNVYTFAHKQYWYVGQIASSALQQNYAYDLSQGWINVNAGIIGITPDFFTHHLGSGSLAKVSLVVLISSSSSVIAPILTNAGARTVIYCNAAITLSFGQIDDVTAALFSYLGTGENVYQAVFNVVSPFTNNQYEDNLDVPYSPPFWFAGDSTVTL